VRRRPLTLDVTVVHTAFSQQVQSTTEIRNAAIQE